MKRFFVLVAAALAVSLAFLAGGCQKAATAASSSEKMPLSIGFWWEAEGHMFGPDDLGEYIENKFNVDIIPIDFDDAATQLRLWAASDSLPDTWSGSPAFETWFADFIREDIIRPIPASLIAKYPTIKNWCDTNQLYQQIKNFYGDYYYIPKPDSVKGAKIGGEGGFYYRKDWAEKLGFNAPPKDMDELYNLLHAFVYNDPDGNGKDDTYGATSSVIDNFCFPFGAFPKFWVNGPGGKVVPGWTDEEPMIQALTWLRRAYSEGLLDTEFPTDWQAIASKFTQGTFGMALRSTTSVWLQRHIIEEFGGAHPEIGNPFDAVGFIVSLAGKSGATPYHEPYGESWGNTFKADISDEKLDKFLEIDEWLAGKEGMDLCNWGFKDKDYRINSDGTYTSLLEGNIVDRYPSRTIIFVATWNYDFDAAENPSFNVEARKMSVDLQAAINVGGVNAFEIVNLFAGTIVTEEKSLFTFNYLNRVMDIITGTGDIRTMYRAMIAEANQQGLQGVIDSVNAALKK
jgi:putative aldouronate transport system substrate-binding protein